MKRIWFFLIAAILLTLPLHAQEMDREMTRLLTYMKHAMLFNQQTPQEKVYLHFDNTAYFKGEHIRFKAYVVRADNQRPTDISRVLHVELLNPSGDVAESRTLRIENGEAEGDIRLDSLFGTGFYEVRAFTRYMINWGGSGIFSRVFPIFKRPNREGDYANPQIDELTYTHRLPGRQTEASQTQGKGNKQADTRPTGGKQGAASNVAFFPEGGNIVAGQPARVAFTVVDKEGRGQAVKAVVNDATGQTVGQGSTEPDGRGLIEIDRAPTSALTCVVTDEKGRKHNYDMPQPVASGCALRLDAISDDIDIHLACTPDLHGRLLGYTLINGGNVVRADTMQAAADLQFTLKRDKMRPGVNQLTLFDSRGRILAERLFFIRPADSDADSIRVKVAAGGQLTPCCPVGVDIEAAPGTSLSFSAVDAAALANGHVGNAQTWMLLTSDVKGYIANPDYYFETDDNEHRRAADLLMMVQGWRRYDWQLQAGVRGFESVEGFTGRLQPIEDKLYVFGQLKPDLNKWRKKHPVGGVDLTVYLFNAGESLSGNALTDSLGNYAFELPDIEGEWNMQIRTKWNDKQAAYVVAVDRHFSPTPRLLSPEETDMIPLPEAFMQLRRSAAGQDASVEGKLQRRGTGDQSTFVLPTVKVKARYFTDNSHLPWYNESTGARRSTVFYNIDESTDRINDEGEPLPTLYEWLLKKNEFFGGTDVLNERMNVVDDTTGELRRMDDPDVSIDQMSNYSRTVYSDGLTYKNRPIIWIVNNQYVTVTHYLRPYYNIRYTTNESGAATLPDFIDEVKSVYISEDDDNYNHFIQADELPALHPVTIFVYTHPQFFSKEKGLRRTHFQGFNVATEFEMEDYSIMPPTEDFRRTLFWAPSVRTDQTGHAHLDFYNNSSCRQIYVSAEGLKPGGGFAVSE